MNPAVTRILKGAVGALVLVALLITVNRWWTQYRDDSTPTKTENKQAESPAKQEAKPEAAEPPAESATPAENKATGVSKSKVVIVRTDGLNFRKEPSQDATVIRGLDKGEQLTYLKEDGGWFQVQDGKGVTGWISSKPQYAELQ